MSLENASPSPLSPVAGSQIPMSSALNLDGATQLPITQPSSTSGQEPQDNEVARRIQAAKSELWENYTALFNWGAQSAPPSVPQRPEPTH